MSRIPRFAPIDLPDEAQKSVLDDWVRKFRESMLAEGHNFVDAVPGDWKHTGGWYETLRTKFEGAPDVMLWLDRGQDAEHFSFYAGVSPDENELCKIDRILEVCGGFCEIRRTFVDKDWIRRKGRAFRTMPEPLPRDDAQLLIFDNSESLGDAVGMYQHLSESDDDFFQRAIDFIGCILEEFGGNEGQSTKEILAAALKAQERESGKITQGIRNVYERSPAIGNWARHRAGGKCECCGNLAPFKNTSNQDFLEVHHIEEVSIGGADGMLNVAAVCPNCHREVHHGQGRAMLTEKLKLNVEKAQTAKAPPQMP